MQASPSGPGVGGEWDGPEVVGEALAGPCRVSARRARPVVGAAAGGCGAATDGQDVRPARSRRTGRRGSDGGGAPGGFAGGAGVPGPGPYPVVRRSERSPVACCGAGRGRLAQRGRGTGGGGVRAVRECAGLASRGVLDPAVGVPAVSGSAAVGRTRRCAPGPGPAPRGGRRGPVTVPRRIPGVTLGVGSSRVGWSPGRGWWPGARAGPRAGPGHRP